MDQQVTADDGIQDAAFTVAGWSVDLSTLRIQKQDKDVKLEPKVMAVLEYLVSRSGQVVSRQDLEQAVWTGTVVGYDAISNAIIKLRKAFGDDAQHPQIIETIPKTGYRLIAAVEVQPGTDLLSPDSNVISESSQAASSEAATVKPPRPAYWKTVIVSTTVLLVLLTLVSVLFEPWVSKVEPASVDRMAFPLPDKPSIAVLPFTNMSADAGQEYFVDGITEDLITDLSKLDGLFVVARNSVFTYKGRTVKIRQVAEELGVRYVLEGSAQRFGDQVRINAQLIDALSGGHVWAERYDGMLDDRFKLQDQVSREIVEQLALNLSLEDNKVVVTRDLDYTEAYDLFFKGWGHFRAGGAADYTKAIEYFKESLARDPDFARAQAGLAAVYWNILNRGWWRESLGVHYYDAFELARKSLRHSQQNPTALTHQIASEWITYYSRGPRNPRRALEEAVKALALDPNNPAGYLAKANALLADNRSAEAQLEVRTAMRLDPHYPPEYLVRLALTEIQLGEYREAVESLNKAIARNPDNSWTQLYLAAAYGLLNLEEEGRQALELANRLRAENGWGPVTIVATANPFFRWQGKRDRLKQGLRVAGVEVGGEWFNLISYPSNGDKSEVKGTTPVNAKEAMRLHDRNAVFVDTTPTWLTAHIPGSHFLEWWGEGWLFNEVALGRLATADTEVVIYSFDDNSKRGVQAVALAKSRGFDKVYYFAGGLDEWKAAGYPVEKPN
jgi:TolB-like protein/DNA-binding winged helix-turn-helix (wHTH) protein/Tfp pilus assembly protein PilF/rhodanese-related sulfurtransferase